MEKCDLTMKLRGSVTVWEKWQIVIPKEVRELLDIKPWDTLVTISKWWIAVWFIKNENIKDVMYYIEDEMKA